MAHHDTAVQLDFAAGPFRSHCRKQLSFDSDRTQPEVQRDVRDIFFAGYSLSSFASGFAANDNAHLNVILPIRCSVKASRIELVEGVRLLSESMPLEQFREPARFVSVVQIDPRYKVYVDIGVRTVCHG